MPYVTTSDDTKLYYKSWGSGTPVVLIHGWPLNADSWDDVALGLASAGYRAIAYDRRGFGRSDQPWNGYDYDTLADDLAAVINGTGAEGAALAGFSMGGGEVARYLSRHGSSKVSAAVLISSVTPFMVKRDDNPDGVDHSVFDQMKEALHEDRAGFLQTFAKQFYGVGVFSKPVSQGILDQTFQAAMFGGLWPTVACVQAFGMTDFRQDMRAFDVPTLIMQGTGDAVVPIDSSGRQTAKLVPTAKVIEYDGGPHGLLATHKVEVTRDLIAFLNESTGGNAGTDVAGSDRSARQPTGFTLQPGA